MQYYQQNNKDKKIFIPKNYHIASQHELKIINNVYKEGIKAFAKTYYENVANKTLDYVFKSHDELHVLSIMFGKENFSHLLGIKALDQKPNQILNNIYNNDLFNHVIFLKNDKSSMAKMKVASSFKNILNSNAVIFSNLNSVERTKRLNLSHGIKSSDENLLLLLRDTENGVTVPASIFNLTKSNTKAEYKDIPENTILGIFEESKTKFEGQEFGVGAKLVDLNHEYINTPKQAMELSQAVANTLLQHKIEKDRQKEKAAHRVAFLRSQHRNFKR